MCSWDFLSYTRRILFHSSSDLEVEREGVWKLVFSELPWCSVLTELFRFLLTMTLRGWYYFSQLTDKEAIHT